MFNFKEFKILPNYLLKLLDCKEKPFKNKILIRSSSQNNIKNKYSKVNFNHNIKIKIKEIIEIINNINFINYFSLNKILKKHLFEFLNFIFIFVQNPKLNIIEKLLNKINYLNIEEKLKFHCKKFKIYWQIIKNKLNYIHININNSLVSENIYNLSYKNEIKNYLIYSNIMFKIFFWDKKINDVIIEKVKCKICWKNITFKLIEEHSSLCYNEKDLISKIDYLNDCINNLIDSILLEKQNYYLNYFENKKYINENKSVKKINVHSHMEIIENISTKKINKKSIKNNKNNKKSNFIHYKNNNQSLKTINNNIKLNDIIIQTKAENINNEKKDDIQDSSESISWFGDKFHSSSSSFSNDSKNIKIENKNQYNNNYLIINKIKNLNKTSEENNDSFFELKKINEKNEDKKIRKKNYTDDKSMFNWDKFYNNIPSYTDKFETIKFSFREKKKSSKEIIEKFKFNNNILSNTIDLKTINKFENLTDIEKLKKIIHNWDKYHSDMISYPYEISLENDILEYLKNKNFIYNESLKIKLDKLIDLIKEKIKNFKNLMKFKNKLKKFNNKKISNLFKFSFRAKTIFLNDEIKNKLNQNENNKINYNFNSNNFKLFRKIKSDSYLIKKKNKNLLEFNKRINVNDFIYIKKLGEGAYGKVVKIQRKSTGDFYALKIIPFNQKIEDSEISSLINERNIFGLISAKFLVSAYFSFINNNNCLFVMELIEGGDFKKLINEYGYWDIEDVKFYAAELILAINYLHSQKIIHRDLKPENLLLDKKGHLKVTDFGLSKIKIKNFEYQLKENDNKKEDIHNNFYINKDTVGTPNYLSYESFDKNFKLEEPVDWWAVGCIIYELAIGKPTFTGNTKYEVFNKIKNINYEFPKIGYNEGEITPELKNLIEKFLEKDPRKRLGSNGLNEIKNHEFFKDFDWNIFNEYGPYIPEYIYNLKKDKDTKEEESLSNYLIRNFKKDSIKNIRKKNISINKNFEMTRFDLLHNQNRSNKNLKLKNIKVLNDMKKKLLIKKNNIIKNSKNYFKVLYD